MKHLSITLLSLLITISSFAQTYLTQARPFDRKEWGYMNEKGEFVIAAKYRKCYQFSDGYAPIYEGKKFFFINAKGEPLKTEIANFKLSNAFGFGLQGFNEGMVQVLVGKKWGYLNANGELAIGLNYEKASKFDGGFAVVSKNGNFFVINKSGEEALVSGAIDVKHFSEGLAPYRASDKMFGFIGTDGKIIINAKYVSVGYFIDGLAWAKTLDKKVGFINKKGEWVISPQYLAAKNFDSSTGLAMVKKEAGWVYTDKTGAITAVIADKTSNFSDGLAKGVRADKTGYYDKTGNWVIKPQFEGGRNFKNGFAAAKKGDKWGFINKKGEWVVQPTFGGVKDMELIK